MTHLRAQAGTKARGFCSGLLDTKAGVYYPSFLACRKIVRAAPAARASRWAFCGLLFYITATIRVLIAGKQHFGLFNSDSLQTNRKYCVPYISKTLICHFHVI